MTKRRYSGSMGWRFGRTLTFACAAIMFGGCTTTHIEVTPNTTLPSAAANNQWALLPVMNFSETPRAGEKAESMLQPLLRRHGLPDLVHYPAVENELALDVDEQRRYDRALEWARKAGYSYGVSGSVDEWRYKSGVEGEPAVGLGLKLVDIGSGQTVWSALGSRSGWGRDSVSGTAQQLLTELVDRLRSGQGN